MKLLLVATMAALILLPAETALAKKNKGKSGGKHAISVLHGCPPGLAKKNKGCRPPGQAKKQHKQRAIEDDQVQREDMAQRRDHGVRTDGQARQARSLGDVSPRTSAPARSVDFVDLASGKRLRVGSRLDTMYRDRFRAIDNPGLFGLAPIDHNRRYFRIGDTAVLVDDTTQVVISLIALKSVLIK